MSDDIRAGITNAAKALCHYPSGPSTTNSCCPGIGRCEMDAAITEIARLRAACDDYFKTISLSEMRHGRILVGLERRNARQRRALAKLYQRRHDKNAEIGRLRAELATAQKYRDAVDVMLKERCNSPVRDHETPLRALQRLINFELTTMALDPKIHKGINDALATARREVEQERDEFFNRLGRITEYLDIPVDATAQRIIEAIQERVDNEREACASVEVRLTVPEGAEAWTPLEAWEEALLAFDEAFRETIRAAAKEGKP